MTVTVTGSPLGAFGDAIYARLAADVALLALAPGGVYASPPRDVRVPLPYVLVGQRREMTDQGGAMQIEGGLASIWVDVWSDKNGPAETQDILSRIRLLLQRQLLPVPGYSMIERSLTCPEELVTTAPDPDLPTRELFHGLQRWNADLEEAA